MFHPDRSALALNSASMVSPRRQPAPAPPPSRLCDSCSSSSPPPPPPPFPRTAPGLGFGKDANNAPPCRRASATTSGRISPVGSAREFRQKPRGEGKTGDELVRGAKQLRYIICICLSSYSYSYMSCCAVQSRARANSRAREPLEEEFETSTVTYSGKGCATHTAGGNESRRRKSSARARERAPSQEQRACLPAQTNRRKERASSRLPPHETPKAGTTGVPTQRPQPWCPSGHRQHETPSADQLLHYCLYSNEAPYRLRRPPGEVTAAAPLLVAAQAAAC